MPSISKSAIATVGVLAALVAVYATQLHQPKNRLLLAPMIGVMNTCVLPPANDDARRGRLFDASCARKDGSASELVESTLSTLGPRFSHDGKYEIGYTLQFSLLSLLKPQGGDWAVDHDAVQRLVRTLRDTDRATVLYLFSTHFGVDAPIEQALMQDPANLSVTPAGPMAQDKYYAVTIHPWSVATTHNELTRRRVQVIDEIVDQICQLPKANLEKIRGVTLLGELHQLFPNFEDGMGYTSPYAVSDYSAESVRGFREFLAQRFGSVAAMNAYLGETYVDFGAVDPPSKNIRTEPLAHFSEHIDSFATGVLPISGWAHVAGASPTRHPWLRIYLDGEPTARTQAHLGRQDVFAALPALGVADVGWRYDLDFSKLPVGVHRIDIVLEAEGERPAMLLGTRHVSVMDRTQRTPEPVAAHPLPATEAPSSAVKFYVDSPVEQSSYFYNPMAALWHEFRGQQVVRYLKFMDARVRRSCLKDTPTYTHQIVPFFNPSWDSNKFAIDASLRPMPPIRLGVSLYGETTYGSSFFDWLPTSGQTRYGVTEFHPLRAMDAREMASTLDNQAAHGAQFVSFFMESRWTGDAYTPDKNMFSFDAKNPQAGSDKLFQSVRAVVSR